MQKARHRGGETKRSGGPRGGKLTRQKEGKKAKSISGKERRKRRKRDKGKERKKRTRIVGQGKKEGKEKGTTTEDKRGKIEKRGRKGTEKKGTGIREKRRVWVSNTPLRRCRHTYLRKRDAKRGNDRWRSAGGGPRRRTPPRIYPRGCKDGNCIRPWSLVDFLTCTAFWQRQVCRRAELERNT